jgi:hypothetical protein
MTYEKLIRHLTNAELLERQKAMSLALDQSIDRKNGQAHNIRRKLWRILDEQDRRRHNK